MDAPRFDALARGLAARATRRATVGAALAGALGLAPTAVEARCSRKKPCSPCRACKRGKCKRRPDETPPRPCGPCRVCQGGSCVALCPEIDCAQDGNGQDICLKECSPPCTTCERCDRILGQCEVLCTADQCIDGFCDVPCDPPCDGCSVCDFGTCAALCEPAYCVNDACDVPCEPTCGPDETCVAGTCEPACNPPCGAGQGCVANPSGNTCVGLAGTCTGGDHACVPTGYTPCTANGRSGRCYDTAAGDPFCASGVTCVACASDVDCQLQGFGANSRCLSQCEFCNGQGCSRFAGE
jgi:hypothetical protein